MLDHPFNSVSWLANNLGRRRHNLHKGAIVLTGCVTETIWLNEGEQMVVEAENLGRISVALRASSEYLLGGDLLTFKGFDVVRRIKN
ncbi:MAG TPA: hypothetical protein EYN14_04945 [Alphaproteobacteria bacterium]|nr:hypothetical protein [Alphaproteobacteria bacterium]